ncbi:unnamed protein product [Sphagnum troendelagicum]
MDDTTIAGDGRCNYYWWRPHLGRCNCCKCNFFMLVTTKLLVATQLLATTQLLVVDGEVEERGEVKMVKRRPKQEEER